MKNPLYVVKGKNVMEARNMFDLVVKKLNLEPMVQMLQTLLKMLLDQVQSYPTFVVVKTLLDELMKKLVPVMAKFGVVT